MQELIEKLKNEHRLSTEQVNGILNTIKNYVKEKFPMIGGAIDNVFGSQEGTDTDIAQAAAEVTPAGDTGTTEGPTPKGGSFLDTESSTPGKEQEKEKQAAKDKLDEMVKPQEKKQ
jgi:hypothetical protein